MNIKHIAIIIGIAAAVALLLHWLIPNNPPVVKPTTDKIIKQAIDSAIAPLHRDNYQLVKDKDSLIRLVNITQAMTSELKKTTWMSKSKLTEIQTRYDYKITHLQLNAPVIDYDSFIARRYPHQN